MMLANLSLNGKEQACIGTRAGFLPVARINSRFALDWPTDMDQLIRSGALNDLHSWHRAGGAARLSAETGEAIADTRAVFAPLYRHPPKIWGIGLNYRTHAQDLSERAPMDEPASFMKPATSIIACGESILIPRQSTRTTAEAELGIVIGRSCKNVPRREWLDATAGFTCVIDMTAEDILRRNPRFLTRSKSFDTFFSFGPVLLTPDEIKDVMRLEVSTLLNGAVHASNRVSAMTFPPDFLVSFHSEVMTLQPGDIISSGTPGAAVIADGDTVACRISGFPLLSNPVKDLKR